MSNAECPLASGNCLNLFLIKSGIQFCTKCESSSFHVARIYNNQLDMKLDCVPEANLVSFIKIPTYISGNAKSRIALQRCLDNQDFDDGVGNCQSYGGKFSSLNEAKY